MRKGITVWCHVLERFLDIPTIFAACLLHVHMPSALVALSLLTKSFFVTSWFIHRDSNIEEKDCPISGIGRGDKSDGNEKLML